MQITNRAVQSYDSNIQERSKLEHTKSSERTGQTQSSGSIAGLKEGTVFKGEVVNISGEKVTISLEDHTQLLARLQEGVELGVGDKLLFSVKENSNSQILIKPLFDSLHSAQTQVLERALDAAGLSPTEKNFSAAKELMDAGMPVDKGNIVKLLSQSMKFEGTSMQTLASLNKLNIPVNEANIAQFERYQGYQHQLTGDIQTAAFGMASFTEAFPEGTSSNTLLSVANQMLDMFIPEQGMEQLSTQDGEAMNGKSLDVPASMTDTVVAEQGVLQNEQGLATGEHAIKDGVSLVKSGEQNVISDPLPNVQEEVDAKSQALQNGDKEIGKNTVSLSHITENTGLTKEGISNLSNLLSKAGISGEQQQTIFQNSNSQEELLKNIMQHLSTGGGSSETIRNVLDSNEFRDMLSEIIKKNWALNPKSMKDPKEIDELYERIVKQSQSFENLITDHGGEPKQFEQNFQNMRQNMQFMEQLNHQMIYAQMPLKLSNQNANSELYVYADKRKLAQKKDGISVMLHLDMDNLGKTDVHVTLTGTNVNTRFYLDDQDSVDIVSEHMNQLAKQLSDRGFSLTNEVVKRQPQESINKVVDEVIDENAERSIKRYTFDART